MTTINHIVNVGDIKIANNLPFALIAGPCQMESRDHAIMVATNLKEITSRLGIPLIFKTSFDKANRSSAKSKRGVGLEYAIKVFDEIKSQLNLPVLTDVHLPEHCSAVADHVDVLQIPAFLCRQTDLLAAAAATGKVVNVKKGQFLAPWDMKNVAEKMEHFNNRNLLLTERGASFGYNTLVTDMRGLTIMAETGYPVIFDATHSVQQPGGLGAASGGERRFVEILSRAALSVGVAGIFMETHDDPDNAPSDGPCMVRLSDAEAMLTRLKRFDELNKSLYNT